MAGLLLLFIFHTNVYGEFIPIFMEDLYSNSFFVEIVLLFCE